MGVPIIAPPIQAGRAPLTTGSSTIISTPTTSSAQTSFSTAPAQISSSTAPAQTSSSASHIPLQPQTLSSPTPSGSVGSSSVTQEVLPTAIAPSQLSQPITDPYSRLTPPVIGALVFAGTLSTVLCLAVLLICLRRKSRACGSRMTDYDTQFTMESRPAPRRGTTQDSNKPRPLGFIHQASYSPTDSVPPCSPKGSEMESIRRMSDLDNSGGALWSILAGRPTSIISNLNSHDGRQTPLRLSNDTCMVLDPYLMQFHQPLEPTHPSTP
ncbi:hypothetical protein PCANC_00809 [Puccinia coronata f. sp. avenae]|uniref:Uncharacterized protein n=1 Tax=Puccinia coronata f. sp. avenae TaxID=200324 RepID=A0A2N5W7V5_9BASI|nr:hypothetical protein PCANC_00809 [Puccinia coronata f. sp. avenae]